MTISRPDFARLVPLAAAIALLGACQIPAAQTTSAPVGEATAATEQGTQDPAQSSTAAETSVPAEGGQAAAALEALAVKGKAPQTGYDRALFPHWVDLDGDGCEADDQAVRAYASTEGAGCREVAATMVDPYSGQTLTWGAKRTGVVDIDHVVSLSNAWVSGAWNVDTAARTALANDQLNLLPTSASLNRQKGDANAAEWLPPAKDARCAYVARQIAVKAKYALSVTAPEKDAMARVLQACPGQELPTSDTPADITSTPPEQPAAPATSEQTSAPAASEQPAAPVDHGSCADAKAAGDDTPFARGVDPEYDFYTDGDNDGLVCE